MTKANLKRTTLIFLILCLTLFLLHSIGWADIVFWRTGIIALVCGVITSIVLLPLYLVPVQPGSFIDSPYFFLPLAILVVFAWSWLISFLMEKRKRAE